jgi:hypothetical protein
VFSVRYVPAMNRRRSVLAMLCTAATFGCGGGAKPDTLGNTTPPPTGPAPALYAGLFTEGARYTYAVVFEGSHWDDTDPAADANGNVVNREESTMTCVVERVTPIGGAVAATLTCNDAATQDVPIADSSPAGMYVASPAGLWRVDAYPAGDGELSAEGMFLAAEPVAAHSEKTDDEGGLTVLDVAKDKAGGWCRTDVYAMGDDGGTTLCFANGVLASGGASWGGGSTREITYTLVE